MFAFVLVVICFCLFPGDVNSSAPDSCSSDSCNDESFPLTDYALKFPNKNVTEYVHIWGMPNLTALTVCFWMKTNDSNSGTPFSYAVPGEDNEILLIGYNNFNVYIGGTKRELSVSANDDQWHHICVSWENTAGSLSFYKDSVLSSNYTNFKTGHVIRSGGSLVIGQDQDSFAGGFDSIQSFQGLISNLNLWDYVLCPDSIRRMSKGCLYEEPWTVYKWSYFQHGMKGKLRLLVPSPCNLPDEIIDPTPTTAMSSSTVLTPNSARDTCFVDTCSGDDESIPLKDYALEFPNKNVTEYVHIWGMPNLTAFTVCFWMKTNDSNSGTPFSYAVPGEDNEILLIGYNNFNVYIEGTKRELSVSANDDQWHHICLSWENTAGSLRFYKDSVLSANYTNFKTGYVIRSGGSLVIGQDQDSFAGGFDSTQSFQGLISNLNLWDYVLCPDSIRRMSKGCLYEEPWTVYKWSYFKHGVKGKPRIVVPSPCHPPVKKIASTSTATKTSSVTAQVSRSAITSSQTSTQQSQAMTVTTRVHPATTSSSSVEATSTTNTGATITSYLRRVRSTTDAKKMTTSTLYGGETTSATDARPTTTTIVDEKGASTTVNATEVITTTNAVRQSTLTIATEASSTLGSGQDTTPMQAVETATITGAVRPSTVTLAERASSTAGSVGATTTSKKIGSSTATTSTDSAADVTSPTIAVETATMSGAVTPTTSVSLAGGATSTVSSVGATPASDELRSSTATASTAVDGKVTTTTVAETKSTEITPSTTAGSKGPKQSSQSTSTVTVRKNTIQSTTERPTAVDPSSTKLFSTTTSVVVPTGLGPEVIISLAVKINCQPVSFIPSSTPYKNLEAKLTTNIRKLYQGLQLKKIYIKSLNCTVANNIQAVTKVTFGTGNPADTNIKKMLEDEVKDGTFYDLPVSSSEFSITFTEVTLGFKVKSGECKRVCCGAGGAVVMIQTCTPQNRCEGIGNSTKEEAGHCPGEEKNTCSDVKCKGSGTSPSFAIIVLLTVGSFFGMTVY